MAYWCQSTLLSSWQWLSTTAQHFTSSERPMLQKTVLLNITDNTSALSWTLHTCKRSRIERLLVCFFCSLLINSPLGINLQWISTNDNKIADDISCLKKQSDTNSAPNFDYTTLNRPTWSWITILFFGFSPSSSQWYGPSCWPRNGQVIRRSRRWNRGHSASSLLHKMGRDLWDTGSLWILPKISENSGHLNQICIVWS